MKESLLLLILLISCNGYSQDLKITNDQEIKSVVNQFFESLETRDTVLMRRTTSEKAQIWRRYSDENPIRFNMRFSKDDLSKMRTLPNVREVAQDFEITERNGIAVAWVPYGFWIKEEFSHCGIDVFTLFKIDGIWKIISIAYTIEKEHCDELMSEE
ncbi:MAG: hypothetical protein ACI9P5_004557 [Saprospiraceae bacterium]|jgi:hypothetical protein